MSKPCDNFRFHHVEVEYVGDDSYTYKYEESDGKNVTEEDPEDGSNPIILKIRLLNISDILVGSGSYSTFLCDFQLCDRPSNGPTKRDGPTR